MFSQKSWWADMKSYNSQSVDVLSDPVADSRSDNLVKYGFDQNLDQSDYQQSA